MSNGNGRRAGEGGLIATPPLFGSGPPVDPHSVIPGPLGPLPPETPGQAFGFGTGFHPPSRAFPFVKPTPWAILWLSPGPIGIVPPGVYGLDRNWIGFQWDDLPAFFLGGPAPSGSDLRSRQIDELFASISLLSHSQVIGRLTEEQLVELELSTVGAKIEDPSAKTALVYLYSSELERRRLVREGVITRLETQREGEIVRVVLVKVDPGANAPPSQPARLPSGFIELPPGQGGFLPSLLEPVSRAGIANAAAANAAERQLVHARADP